MKFVYNNQKHLMNKGIKLSMFNKESQYLMHLLSLRNKMILNQNKDAIQKHITQNDFEMKPQKFYLKAINLKNLVNENQQQVCLTKEYSKWKSYVLKQIKVVKIDQFLCMNNPFNQITLFQDKAQQKYDLTQHKLFLNINQIRNKKFCIKLKKNQF
ncbi:unnamed protein product (macronuclear) [Paramecium tetraurelia]|uniref:Uncharacterized protein n=1 Tax=Paramecium tetraurelia TaxID=5888 RepID=A0C9W2_PARTE|nr:uncharacterized protein GSPATT00006886001 [Paramecium tetraurelia]CAK67579.1 unnamed protein product [Paramecium tetraurelia]|eukprot:XP_001434976.1 hypothetical protein (macronuclear) [Paramecium tetraurelia strain d4-2]